MRKVTLGLLALACFVAGTAAFAAISGAGSVATQVTTNLGAIARFVTAAAYVAGMAFAIGALVKLKAHKDNPQQVHLSQGVVLLFLAAALLFMPTIFKVAGGTMFGSSGTVAGISGIASFGAPKGGA